MRIVIRYALYAVAVGIITLFLSYALSKDSDRIFFGNFLLNLVAEFIGFAFGGVLAAIVASKLAADKLDNLAPDFVRLVTHLRRGRTITRKAARQCVICAVRFISDDALSEVRQANSSEVPETNGSISLTTVKCPVCKLDAETVGCPDGQRKCLHCHLRGNVWDAGELKI